MNKILWYKIKVLLKSMTGEKNSLPAIWKLACVTIGYISAAYTFSVLLKNLTGFGNVEIICKSHWGILVVGGIIVAIFQKREPTSYKGTVKNDNLQIEVKVDDLFWVKASSYVIPTNTFFRTVMDDEYVSPTSVQGRFQLKYFKHGTTELDKMIAASLEQQGIKGEDSSDIHGSVKRYPLGTIAKVDYKRKHYYFVAITDVNKVGKPENQKYSNVNITLNALMEFINNFGHYDDLAMPLIGTGRAAIREATIEKVVADIVDQFVNSHYKIARNVTICISLKDYLDGKVDLKRIKKYIDYKCEFNILRQFN